MAKEYIDREVAIEAIKNDLPNIVNYRKADAMECLETLPAADVAEVQHGKWVYYECVSSGDGLKSGYACSVCSGFVNEDIFDMDEFNKVFCGACGAKMDGNDSVENKNVW